MPTFALGATVNLDDMVIPFMDKGDMAPGTRTEA